MPKFTVSLAGNPPTGPDGAVAVDRTPSIDQGQPSGGGSGGAGDADGHVVTDSSTDDVSLTIPMEDNRTLHKNLFLFEEDMKQMPRVATFVKSMVGYRTTIPTEKEAKEAKKQPKQAKLGLVLGVYLPTIQHIFGVLMFVRLGWIVGLSGFLESFFMVFMCCLTTFLTAISMSAIATNGMVQAGGSYFMISRNLGPECGGAVGICFYLANTFATDLYLLGSIEILLQYMAPQIAFFGDIHHNPFNNYRVYGTVLVIILTLVVAVGVKFVAFFAPFSLSCVVISIVCIIIGSFQANEFTRNIWLCIVGDRLQVMPDSGGHGDAANATTTAAAYIVQNITDAAMTTASYVASDWCSNSTTGDLWARYCSLQNGTEICDPYWEEHSANIQYIPGIPGITSGVINRNLFSHYLARGEVTPGVVGNSKHEVVSDMSTSFIALCAIYFPSVTGIMTGSNMSGDLRDPQKSIPLGTILAQVTCSFVYLTFVVLFGLTSEGHLLRDKFGHSIGGRMLAAELAWPTHWIVLVGAFCSTLGAALQCITSAPRLLQAIARDNIIPFLDVFKVTTKNGEPLRALILTALIAECGILIASLDYVAPVIDVFFLMCYGFVNLTCALQTLLKSPNWRPRFKYYHWTLSILGVALNLALSIIAGWYYALSAFAIAGFIYKYVEYKGGEKEWGDGIHGLSMAAAQRALLKLEEGDPHTKNWRPQLLVLCKVEPDGTVKYPRIFNYTSQLKAGKGLTVCAAVMKGEYLDKAQEAATAKENLKEIMKKAKVKGFAKVMVTKDVTEGLNIFVQTVGLGGMRHNTVVVGWPYGWKTATEERSWKVFLDTVKCVAAKELALLVPRNIENFPDNKERLSGTIDVWWIVHDGGMLILLSFLLKQHKVWRNCTLRIFTVAQMFDNSIQLKKDLELFLYQLRINAEVFVEEMYDNDISAYTVERTLDMEKRAKMLKQMKLTRRGTIQEIVDASHKTGTPPPGQRRMSIRKPVGKEEDQFKAFVTPADDDIPAIQKSRSAPPPEESTGLLKVPKRATQVPPTDDNNIMSDDDDDGDVQFTFTPAEAKAQILAPLSSLNLRSSKPREDMTDAEKERDAMEKDRKELDAIAEGKLMRMHTAVRLNNSIKNKSGQADVVIINFPAPPANLTAEENYMEYLEVLTDGIDRVIMARGSGKEVVTIYS